jgi:molybdopterin molybdotransferase
VLTIEAALARILADVPRLPAEDVGLADAYGRVLARDVVSPSDVPPWDNSAMDGFAVRSADLAGITAAGHDCDDEHAAAHGDGVQLMINETVGAGGWPVHRVRPGSATAVMTGAPIPDGSDAVVMVEDTVREDQLVRVRSGAVSGQHIRRRGADVKQGSVVLRGGTRLTPPMIGIASGVGLTALPCVRPPRIAILSTGDEVVAPGTPLRPGQIWSSNNASLVGLVREAGGDALDRGTAADRPDALIAAIRGCIDTGADAVITTGGVSVGEFDFVKDAFAALGADIDFWKVRMKPGKPLAFGRVGGVPLFGLPGNPVSCVVNFLEFVRPWMRRAMGVERAFLPVVDATLAEPIRERPGRVSLVRVILEDRGGQWFARPAPSQSSGVLTSLVLAHGLALIAHDSAGGDAGERVRVQLLDPGFLDRADPGFPW